MTRKPYAHSAYWYAYHNGWTYSEAKSLAAKYWDVHTYRPRKRDFTSRLLGDGIRIDTTFNPLVFAACAMVDVGNSLRETGRRWATPGERAKRRAELARRLRILRRPFYYARETERRRALAAERRRLHRRRTLAPMPTAEALLGAWERRKELKERMIILGGMLHDLECYVDNCLRFDGNGNVVGRNGGIRGWLKENLPELSPKYKTLMRYKAMAVKLRQATGTKDPTPTEELLREEPKREFIAELLGGKENTFESLARAIEFAIDPDKVLAKQDRVWAGSKRVLAKPDEVLADLKRGFDRPDKVLAKPDGVLAKPKRALADLERGLAKKSEGKPELRNRARTKSRRRLRSGH